MTGSDANGDAADELSLAQLLQDGLFIDGDWVESKDQDPDGDVRLIQLADIGDGIFRDRSSRFLTTAKAQELRCTFLEPDDILVARMPDPLGRACIFPGVGQPAVTAVDVCILRPDPTRARADWLVNAPHVRSAMEEYVRGTTRQRISRKNLGKLTLRVPSVAVQAAVAVAVDRVETKRHSAARHVASARAAVESFRGAVLIAACSGGLTADWREAHPDSAAVAIASSDTPVSPLFDAPASWQWTSLESLAEIRGGIQVGAKRNASETLREVPYLRVANVQRGWLDLSEVKTIAAPDAKIAALRLQPGDIFFNEGGDRDKLGRGWVWEGQLDECIHQNHVFRARLHDSGFEPRFFSWYGNSFGARYFIDEGKQTVNLASLSKTRLGRLPVPVPPVAEQREIVSRTDAMLASVDRLASQIDHTSATLDRVSRAALAKALRGELVPTEVP